MKKILTINPGSTSTKLAYFEDDTPVLEKNLNFPKPKSQGPVHVLDEYDARMDSITRFLDESGIRLEDIDIVVSRGGAPGRVEYGAYAIDRQVVQLLSFSAAPTYHASNLAPILAYSLARRAGNKPAIFYDAVSADLASPLAHISGIPGIPRRVGCHNLNTRMVGREGAARLGKRYEDCRFVIAHLGGGISVSAHDRGVITDSVMCDEGPMGPQRAGRVSFLEMLQMCYVKRDRAAGRHFEPGNMMRSAISEKLPPVWLCFLPILVVIVAYTFLNIEAWVSITFGLLATIVCLYRYIPQEEGKSRFGSVIRCANDGVLLIPLQFMLMVLPTMVMSMSPAFQWGVDALSQNGINPYLSFALLSVVLVSFSGAGAIPTICTVALSGYIGQSMSMYACVIIATWACTVFDSLPTNAAIVIQSELCDCPMKRAYPTIFTTTIAATGVITILATLAAVLGVFG